MSSTDIPIESVKVKEEKLDPEIERKLNPNIFPDSTNLQDDATHVDEKKNIEPIKSSNEILAELFKVFNATPPEELLNNDKLVKKTKKEHKRSKHKKSKKHKRKSGEISDISDNESLHSGSSKHKKKKHKRKHKKHRDKDDDHVADGEGKTVIMAADSSSSSKLKKSVKTEPIESVDIKQEKSSLSKSECRDRIDKRLQSCPRVEEVSDVTLSDEETYLRERNRFKESENTESPKRPEYDRYRNDFYRNSNNSYYSSKRQDRSYRYNHRSRSRSRLRTRSRSASKSRSRSPYRDLGIDKKRLLEIARKNAITMFKNGSLPGCATMSEEIKDKVLLKMRYGGKTVQDLTDFCRKLTKKDNYDELSDFSSEEDSDMDKQGNAKAFHHPFVLKDREPIVMHIKNATPIVPKTADQKKAITMQFPVSSGQQHRLTEAWVPVPAKEPEIPPLMPATAKQVPNKLMGIPKNVFQKQLPVAEQQPAFKPLPGGGAIPTPDVSPQEPVPVAPPVPIPVPMSVPPPPIQAAPIAIAPITIAPIRTVPTPQIPIITPPTPQSVYPVPQQTVDVSMIISQRLSAMRRLQENPMDCEAIKMMYTSQKEMTSWASSKHMPGQFTGSTGANILSARELTSGSQAWARKDQLTSTVPVSGGMGMHLLKKMGWKPGEGLGREKTGSLQPLLLDVKLDKRGLVADEEVNGNRQSQKPPPAPNAKRKKNNSPQVVPSKMSNLEKKHPVCLLNELSTKRKWTPPMYELVTDEGPSHNKFFVFSVNVNGQVFTPTAGGNTKKEAKLVTARHCLQQMGVLASAE